MLISSKISFGKEKTSVWYRNIPNESIFTALKEKAPIYVDVAGLTNNQQNKKG